MHPSRPPLPRLLAAAFALMLAGLGAAGCSPAGVALGAGAVAGSAALEERKFTQVVDDEANELAISKRLAEYSFDTFRRVNVEVWEGRAVLTGIVPEAEARVEAVRQTWQTEGIVDVVNEILIGTGPGVFDTSYDVRIAAELRADITFDSAVRAVNYAVEAVAGTVYLTGIAASEAERARVIAHAREIAHVRRIVDHTLLKDGPERKRLLEQLAEDRARRAQDADKTDGSGTAADADG